MANYRHYDIIAHVSSRKRTLLRRALDTLESSIVDFPKDYKSEFGISANETLMTHLRDINNLRTELNLNG